MAPVISDDCETASLPKIIRVAARSTVKNFTFSDHYFDFNAYFEKKKASHVNYIYEDSERTIYVVSSDPECHDLLFSSISAAGEHCLVLFLLPHIATPADIERYCEATHVAGEHCTAIQDEMESGANFQAAVEKVLRKVPRSTVGFSDQLSVWEAAKRATGKKRHSSPMPITSLKAKPAGAPKRTSHSNRASPMQTPTTPSIPAQGLLRQDSEAKDILLNELRCRLDENAMTIETLQRENEGLARAAEIQKPRMEALQKELQTAQSECSNAVRATDDLRIEVGQQLLQKDATIKTLKNQLNDATRQSPNTQEQHSSSQAQLQTVLAECGKRDRRIALLECEVRKLKDDVLKKFYQLEEERERVTELEAKISRGTKRAHDSLS